MNESCVICGDGADARARYLRRQRYHELEYEDSNADFLIDFCDACWDDYNLNDM